MDVLWVPPETTDWAPVAAQVAERKPQAIGVALPSMVPFINALDNEGITPSDVPIQTAVTLLPPEQIKQLGSKADGIYLVTQVTPATDTSNPGVKQMLKEFDEPRGSTSTPSQSSPAVVTAWANVHIFADIVGALPKQEIASLDSAKLVDVFKKAPPVSRPEYARVRLQQERVSGHRGALRAPPLLPAGDGAPGRGRQVRVGDPVRRRHEAVQAEVVTGAARH